MSSFVFRYFSLVTILISQSVAKLVGMGIASITINAVLYLRIISIDGINSLR